MRSYFTSPAESNVMEKPDAGSAAAATAASEESAATEEVPTTSLVSMVNMHALSFVCHVLLPDSDSCCVSGELGVVRTFLVWRKGT